MRPCVWLHDAAISPEDVALRTHPDAVVVFVLDAPALQQEPWAFHRLSFMYEGIVAVYSAIPHVTKEVRVGDTLSEILTCCVENGCDTIAVTDHPDPLKRFIIERLQLSMTVQIYPRDQLVEYDAEPKRFSPYWNKVQKKMLGNPSNRKRKYHQ